MARKKEGFFLMQKRKGSISPQEGRESLFKEVLAGPGGLEVTQTHFSRPPWNHAARTVKTRMKTGGGKAWGNSIEGKEMVLKESVCREGGRSAREMREKHGKKISSNLRNWYRGEKKSI